MSCASVELLNPSCVLDDYYLFSSHSALVDPLAREGAAQDLPGRVALGAPLEP